MKASVKLVRTGARPEGQWVKYYMTYRNAPEAVKSHFIWLPDVDGSSGELFEDLLTDMINGGTADAPEIM